MPPGPDHRTPGIIANLFVRAGRTHAELPAVALGPDVLLRYRQLVRRGAIIAGRLRAAFGLAPGDRMALIMKNAPEYIELLLAGWYAGLTMVPRELEYILGHSGARVGFVTPDLSNAVAPLEHGASFRRLFSATVSSRLTMAVVLAAFGSMLRFALWLVADMPAVRLQTLRALALWLVMALAGGGPV